jgi:Flp pilus assembly protein TadG
MMTRRSWRLHRTDASAAVEFALACPILLLFLGAALDFGLAGFGKASLADAVAAGAQYAVIKGGGTTALAVKQLVETTANLKAANGTSLVTATVTGPACYCVSTATPPVMTSATCGSTCASDSQPAGQYVLITATYTYQALLPQLSKFTGASIVERATARLP